MYSVRTTRGKAVYEPYPTKQQYRTTLVNQDSHKDNMNPVKAAYYLIHVFSDNRYICIYGSVLGGTPPLPPPMVPPPCGVGGGGGAGGGSTSSSDNSSTT